MTAFVLGALLGSVVPGGPLARAALFAAEQGPSKGASAPAADRAPAAQPPGYSKHDKLPGNGESSQPPRERPSMAQQAVYDLLLLRPERGADRSLRIQLIPRMLELPLARGQAYDFPLFLASGAGVERVLGQEVIGVEYYEQRMGQLAATQLGMPLAQFAEPGRAVRQTDDWSEQRAAQADRILRDAIAQHDSAVQRRIRLGTEWTQRFRQPLVQARINLTLGRIDLLLRRDDLASAEAECERIAAELAPGEPAFSALADRVDKLLRARGEAMLARGDHTAARTLIERFSAQFPGMAGPARAAIEKSLVARARQIVGEVHTLRTDSPRTALERLDAASAIWPGSVELDAVRRELTAQRPTLRCAVPVLPRDLCPLTAREPIDRYALALVCEGLVQWVEDPAIGPHYASRLADGPPIPLPRGRGFRLPRAKWSDSTDTESHLCTVEDVRFTVKLLEERRASPFGARYAGWIRAVEAGEGSDPFTAMVSLSRDYWQPLALMDFPVLPRHYFAGATTADEQAARLKQFGQRPVGTGPYRLIPATPKFPDVIRFEANPHYRFPGLPRIPEISFERYDPARAVELFLLKRLHLVYDLRPEQAQKIEHEGYSVVRLRTPTVWFLAPNYERKPMQNANLRLALASAIDRQAILDQCFRRAAGDHAALAGPYPTGTWASNPRVEGYQRANAKALAELAARQLDGAPKLRLVYPAGNPEVEKACALVELQARQAGITLELRALDAAGYYGELAATRDFDLAYESYFYPDATYAIEPLLGLDAGEPGTGDLMRFRPDEELAGLLRDLRLHKSFPEIQKRTHRIHEHLARSAVVIPLWQLDTYVAISAEVQNASLDPRVLFGQIERWRLEVAK